MHKALRANAPLPYPQWVTLFLRYFQSPLDDEPFVQVKRSFAIGAGVVTSFDYCKDCDGQWLRKQDLPHERTPSPPPQKDVSSALKSFLNFVGFEHSSVTVSMPWIVVWMPWMHVS